MFCCSCTYHQKICYCFAERSFIYLIIQKILFLVQVQKLTHQNILHFVLVPCLVLDTAAGVWCDTKSVVTSPRTGRYSADAAGGDAAVELTRRCRHAAAAVGDLIFIYGGLRGGKR